MASAECDNGPNKKMKVDNRGVEANNKIAGAVEMVESAQGTGFFGWDIIDNAVPRRVALAYR
jgi:hypothetical protein